MSGTNSNPQGGEQITVAKNNIGDIVRQTGIESYQRSDGENNDLAKDVAKQILRKKLFKTSFKYSQKSLAAQFHFYRNSDIRAQQKHLAELQNLEVQHKILELELKIKQKEFDNK